MNERIRKLRRTLDLTQQEFAQRIGATQNTLTGYETGRRSPSASVINNICKTFYINEDWLRTGEGEMFIKLQKNDLVSKAATLLGEKDLGFEALVETYSKLSPANRKVLLEFWTDFTRNMQKPSNPS